MSSTAALALTLARDPQTRPRSRPSLELILLLSLFSCRMAMMRAALQMRVDKWRYTEWVAHSNNDTKRDWNGADWSRIWGRELYSHEASPVPRGDFDYEGENAAEQAQHAELVRGAGAQHAASQRVEGPAAPHAHAAREAVSDPGLFGGAVAQWQYTTIAAHQQPQRPGEHSSPPTTPTFSLHRGVQVQHKG